MTEVRARARYVVRIWRKQLAAPGDAWSAPVKCWKPTFYRSALVRNWPLTAVNRRSRQHDSYRESCGPRWADAVAVIHRQRIAAHYHQGDQPLDCPLAVRIGAASVSACRAVFELARARHRSHHRPKRTHYPRISQSDIISVMSRRLGHAK
jgi:hypothetical protein